MSGAVDESVKSVLERDRRRRRRRRVILLLLALVLFGAVGVFVASGGLQPRDPGPRFQMGEVTRGDLRVVVTATGTLQAKDTVEVGAEVSGRLIEVPVDFNDPVKTGDLLARIDPVPFQQEVTQARARLLSAQASLADAEAAAAEAASNRRRAEALAAEGLISRQDLDARIAGAQRAEASIAAARAKVAEATAASSASLIRQGKTTILSPIDGIVLDRRVEVGQTVTAGFQTPVLFSLARDLAELELQVAVDEADVGRLAEGQEASFTVDAHAGRVFPSRVLSIRNVATTTQNVVTYTTLLAVENRERLLRPGMTATATIVATQVRDALLVPNAAFRFRPALPAPEAKASGQAKRSPFMFGPPRPPGQRPARPRTVEAPGSGTVWVLGPDGQPAPRVVQKGVSDGIHTVVGDGELQPGQEIIVGQASAPVK